MRREVNLTPGEAAAAIELGYATTQHRLAYRQWVFDEYVAGRINRGEMRRLFDYAANPKETER